MAQSHIVNTFTLTEENIVVAAFTAVGEGIAFTKDVPGANVGDFCVATLSSIGTKPVSISATVSEVDKVTVVLTNGGGAADDLDNDGTLKILVMQVVGDSGVTGV